MGTLQEKAEHLLKHLFYKKEENRLRSLWRILVTTSIAITLCLLLVILQFAINQTLFLGWNVMLAIAVFVALLIASVFVDKRPFRSFGLHISGLWAADFAAGFFIAAAAMTTIVGIMLGMGWARVEDALPLTGISIQSGVLLFFVSMLAVGFWEEAYFRGYLIINLKEGLNAQSWSRSSQLIAAVFLSSLFFSAGHINNPAASVSSTINLIIAGLVLAYPFVRTGSLGLSVGLHASWNFFQGAVYGLPVSGISTEQAIIQTRLTGPESFTGGAFGPEAGAGGLLGLMILLTLSEVYITFAYKNKKAAPLI
ncbi:MAG: lysostaphin resistance A-like protein [Balneolaceae bacterium]